MSFGSSGGGLSTFSHSNVSGKSWTSTGSQGTLVNSSNFSHSASSQSLSSIPATPLIHRPSPQPQVHSSPSFNQFTSFSMSTPLKSSLKHGSDAQQPTHAMNSSGSFSQTIGNNPNQSQNQSQKSTMVSPMSLRSIAAEKRLITILEDEATAARAQVSSLTKDLASLSADLQASSLNHKREIQALHTEIADLRKDAIVMIDQRAAFERDLSNLKNSLIETEFSLHEAETAKAAALQQSNDATIEAECAILQFDIVKSREIRLSGELLAEKKRSSQLEKILQDSESALAASQKELQTTIDGHTRTLRQIERTHATDPTPQRLSRAVIENANLRRVALRSIQVGEMGIRAREFAKGLLQQLAYIVARLNGDRTIFAESVEDAIVVNSHFSYLKRVAAECRAALEVVDAEDMARQEKLESIQVELLHCRNHIEENTDLLTKAGFKISKLEDEKSVLEEKNRSTSSHIRSLTEQLEASTQTIAQLEMDLSEAKNTIQALENDTSALEASKQSLEQHITDLNTRVINISSELQKSESLKDGLKVEESFLRAEYDRIVAQLALAEQEAEEARTESKKSRLRIRELENLRFELAGSLKQEKVAHTQTKNQLLSQSMLSPASGTTHQTQSHAMPMNMTMTPHPDLQSTSPTATQLPASPRSTFSSFSTMTIGSRPNQIPSPPLKFSDEGEGKGKGEREGENTKTISLLGNKTPMQIAAQLASLSEELSRSQSETDKYRRKSAQFEARLQAVQEELAKLRGLSDQIEAERTEVQRLKCDLEDAMLTINRLERVNRESGAKPHYGGSNTINDAALRAQLDQQEIQLEKLNEKNANILAQLTKAHTDLDTLRSQTSSEKNPKLSMTYITKLEKQNEQLKDYIKKYKEDGDRHIQATQEELEQQRMLRKSLTEKMIKIKHIILRHASHLEVVPELASLVRALSKDREAAQSTSA